MNPFLSQTRCRVLSTFDIYYWEHENVQRHPRERNTASKAHEIHGQLDTHPLAFNTSMADLKEPTPGKISLFALSMSCGSLTYAATVSRIISYNPKNHLQNCDSMNWRMEHFKYIRHGVLTLATRRTKRKTSRILKPSRWMAFRMLRTFPAP